MTVREWGLSRPERTWPNQVGNARGKSATHRSVTVGRTRTRKKILRKSIAVSGDHVSTKLSDNA